MFFDLGANVAVLPTIYIYVIPAHGEACSCKRHERTQKNRYYSLLAQASQ